MAIDWDAELLAPVMAVFGEGDPSDPTTWPTYMPVSGVAFQLSSAVFDREYLDVTLADPGSENTSRRPVLGVRLALFEQQPVPNDKVLIPSVGVTYIVREVRPDSHGEAKLMLMAVTQP